MSFFLRPIVWILGVILLVGIIIGAVLWSNAHPNAAVAQFYPTTAPTATMVPTQPAGELSEKEAGPAIIESTPTPSAMATAPKPTVASNGLQMIKDFYGVEQQLPAEAVEIISPETDWKVVVWTGDGRIFMPVLPEEKDRPAFDNSFTGRCPGHATTCKMTFHGINATLLEDTNKDGTPETTLASKVGSKVVEIKDGGWYKVQSGSKNGGADLVPVR